MGESNLNLNIVDTVQLGIDSGNGNILAIQPWMLMQDYADKNSFSAKLDGYFKSARDNKLIGRKTLVVLPEFIGTWLACLDEPASVFSAPSLNLAMRGIVFSNFWRFLLTLPQAKNQNMVRDAIFRMKAEKMARTFQTVFSSLAKKYQVTVVAGSIALPEPTIQQGEIHPGKGLIYNSGFVFRKDGTLHEQVVLKAFPIPDEQGFIAPGLIEELPVFETDLGRLGVLICADSWFPQSYQVMKEKRAEIIVVPSFLTGHGIWDQPWQGYEEGRAPDDVQEPPNKLSEGEAWHKYAVAGRLKESGVQVAVNVFLKGRFWDLGADGRTLGMNKNELLQASGQDGAAFLNVWL